MITTRDTNYKSFLNNLNLPKGRQHRLRRDSLSWKYENIFADSEW